MVPRSAALDSPAGTVRSSLSASIDFGRPFRFIFEDADWIRKVLIGGVFNLLSLVLVGLFFVYGYCARAARNIAAGVDTPLPDWDQNARDFREGAKLFLIFFIYELPVLLLFAAGLGQAASIDWLAQEDQALRSLLGGGFIAALLGSWILAIAIAAVLPAALTLAVMKERFSAGFELVEIVRYIRSNAGNYAIAMGVLLVANFVAQYGTIFVFVGVFFTAFWAQLAMTHAFAQAWRKMNG